MRHVSVCPAHSTEYGVVAVFSSGVAHLLSHCSQEEDRSTEDQEQESKQEHESHSTARGRGRDREGSGTTDTVRRRMVQHTNKQGEVF